MGDAESRHGESVSATTPATAPGPRGAHPSGDSQCILLGQSGRKASTSRGKCDTDHSETATWRCFRLLQVHWWEGRRQDRRHGLQQVHEAPPGKTGGMDFSKFMKPPAGK